MCDYVSFLMGRSKGNIIYTFPTGDIIYAKSRQREQCERDSLSSEKVNLIVTDGALVERSAVQTEAALSLSCHAWFAVLHPLAFCTWVSGKLQEVMDRVMRDINSVSATSNISV